jgi:hypothetical protein
MATEALKSLSITNRDADPTIANTAGAGASARLITVSDTILPVTGKTAPSTYRVCRIPTNVKVKHVRVCSPTAATDFDADIGLYYSDSLTDGTPGGLAGTVIDSDFFSAAQDFDAAAVVMTDVTFLNPTSGYLVTDANTPIWNAANSGLTADPGGMFDVVLTTTVTNSVPTVIYVEVEYAL